VIVSQGTVLDLLSAAILVVLVVHWMVDRRWLPHTWRAYWLVQVLLYVVSALVCGVAMTIAFDIWVGLAVVVALIPAFWFRVVRTWLRRENKVPTWVEE